MNEINKFRESIPEGRCTKCEYARTVFATGNYKFLGCYHMPYTGKRVAEIKKCPKEEGKPNETQHRQPSQPGRNQV